MAGGTIGKAVHGVLSPGGHPVCGLGAGNGRFQIAAARRVTAVERVTCVRCLRAIAASLTLTEPARFEEDR